MFSVSLHSTISFSSWGQFLGLQKINQNPTTSCALWKEKVFCALVRPPAEALKHEIWWQWFSSCRAASIRSLLRTMQAPPGLPLAYERRKWTGGFLISKAKGVHQSYPAGRAPAHMGHSLTDWILPPQGMEIVQTMNSDPGLAVGVYPFSAVPFWDETLWQMFKFSANSWF